MKKRVLYNLIYTVALMWLITGCAASRIGGGNMITVTSQTQEGTLVPDSSGNVNLDLCFHIPSDYFSKRSRLVIVPQVMVQDSVIEEMTPLVLDAPIYDKKRERLVRLTGYKDDYAGMAIKVDKPSQPIDVPYKGSLYVPKNVEDAQIVGVVTTDGCGECSSIDTVLMATTGSPVTLIDVKEALVLNWIEPEFTVRPKVVTGKGVANLKFGMSRFDIDLSLEGNRAELEDMVATLEPLLKDSLTKINSLDICGMASADGSLAHNNNLAISRAKAAKEWLLGRLGADSYLAGLVNVSSRPVGWTYVLKAMTMDNNPDSVAVKAIIEKYSEKDDDVQEYYIRRLPCWGKIRTSYLQKERMVEYIYTYTIKNFTTDEELLQIFESRPELCNEEELLRVSTLAETDEKKREVYQTILQYFPQSRVATNNLAVLYLREGNQEKAQELLDNLQEHSEETLNSLAASYVYAGDYERAIELLQEVEQPQARYNLGLLMAKERKLARAYELLLPFADLNSAIVALSISENDKAGEILASLEEYTPVAEYVRSLFYARKGERDNFYKHIGNGCVEEKLRKRAATEPDFAPYKEEPLFRTIIDKR